jgi:hypothetical protein
MLQSPIKVVWALMLGEIYNGKHGMSLKLDGLKGVNDNARARGGDACRRLCVEFIH